MPLTSGGHNVRTSRTRRHYLCRRPVPPRRRADLVEASHFDVGTAYAAINRFRLDDLRPHIYRTRDGGRTWQHITAGMPEGGIVNAVREDPVRRGLLFAGTEQAVYVSFDDGESWQSLRLNMPATSIRDLVVKMNPRVKTPPEALRAQLDRSLEVVEDLARSAEALPRVKKARARAPEGPKAQELAAQEARLSALNGRLATVYAILQDVDAAPTPAAVQAARELRQELAAAIAAAAP